MRQKLHRSSRGLIPSTQCDSELSRFNIPTAESSLLALMWAPIVVPLVWVPNWLISENGSHLTGPSATIPPTVLQAERKVAPTPCYDSTNIPLSIKSFQNSQICRATSP